MRIIKGNATSQYAIIIGLVILTLIPVFYVFGGTLTKSFKDFLDCLKGNSTTVIENSVTSSPKTVSNNDILNGTVTAGQLGGSSKNPINKCDSSNSVCVIDYGNFILNGVPADFSGFIEAQGTSGGTEKLLSLIEQIAKQLEVQGDLDGAAEFRDLANLGHFISDYQETVEDMAKSCSNTADAITCLGTAFEEDPDMNIPDNLVELLPQANTLNDRGFLSTFNKVNNIPFASYNYHNNLDLVNNNNDLEIYPSFTFIDKYNQIIENPKYSDVLKGIATELYYEISDISFNLHGVTAAINQDDNQDSFNVYDPITGERVGTQDFTLDENLQNITKPQTSIGTDLNSILICASGWNKDSGSNCH